MKTRLPHLISLLFIIFFYKISFSQVAPTGEPFQAFCLAEGLTLTDLAVFNTGNFTNIFWFDGADQSTANQLTSTSPLTDGATYYAFQAIGNGASHLEILVSGVTDSGAPIIEVNPVAVCQGEVVTLGELPVENTAGFTGIIWYTDPGQVTPLPSSAPAVPGADYYAFQGVGTCAAGLLVSLEESSLIPAPTIEVNPSPVCEGEVITLGELPVNNTAGFTEIIWYGDSGQVSPLPSSTPVVPGTNYYAFQGVGACAADLLVMVEEFPTIIAPTIAVNPVPVCEGEAITLGELQVENTAGFTEIIWYADSGQVTPLPSNTPALPGTDYYAFQGVGICAVGLLVSAEEVFTVPGPTGDSPQNFNLNENLTLADLVVYNTTGFTNLIWFDGPDQATANILDPSTKLLVDGETYYVFQGIGPCSLSLAITVNGVTSSLNENELSSFELYPNPVKNTLTIKINNQTNIDIVISDIHGRKVYKEIASVVDETIDVNVSNLNSGVYFISLITNNHKSTKKFVKK